MTTQQKIVKRIKDLRKKAEYRGELHAEWRVAPSKLAKANLEKEIELTDTQLNLLEESIADLVSQL